MKPIVLWLVALLGPSMLVAAPPPAPPAAGCPAPAAPRGPTYLLASQTDLVTLLPPPPAADSATQRADLQAVIDAQRAAHSDDGIAHAIADAEPTCGRFSDAVGAALNDKANAKVIEFLNRAAIEGASLAGPPKRYWKRVRPFASSDQVERLGDMAPDWKARAKTDAVTRDIDAGRKPSDGAAIADAAADVATKAPGCSNDAAPVKLGRHARQLAKEAEKAKAEKEKADKDKAAKELAHSSYPSGHSTFGTVCAILLADMVPEKRDELFARSRDYGHSRLVLGAHYPSDVESGRIVGTVAVQLLMQNARFQRDFADARSTLRTALQLPAQTPDLEPDKEPSPEPGPAKPGH